MSTGAGFVTGTADGRTPGAAAIGRRGASAFIVRLLLQRHDPARAWTAAIFAFALFAPTFPDALGTLGAIIVNGGLVVLLASAMIAPGMRVRFLTQGERTVYRVLVGCLAYYMIAVGLGVGLLSPAVIVSDTFELHKPVLHALALSLPFAVVRGRADVAFVERVLGVGFLGVVAVSAVQFVGLTPLAALYTEASNIRMGRLSAPFGNPYDYAFALTLFVYVYLFRFLKRADGRALAAAAAGLGLIVLSQSRTNAIVVGGALACLVPGVLIVEHFGALARLRAPRAVLRYGWIYLLGALAVYALIMTFREELAYLIGGIAQLIREGSQSSLDERLRQFRVVVDRASDSLVVALFGNGISKSVMRLLESGYTFFLFRFGLVGLVVIFFAPLVLVAGLTLRAIGRAHDADRHLQLGVLVWLLTIPVASIGNTFTEQPRLSFLYYFLLGFAVRCHTLGAGPAVAPRTAPAAVARPPRTVERDDAGAA
ncbi:MAG TPA: hypothetical protein VF212_03345 [Longimicrobiales bacterium]